MLTFPATETNTKLTTADNGTIFYGMQGVDLFQGDNRYGISGKLTVQMRLH